jgi:cephalosporin-C deacetylase-like acetyl esterase
MSTRSCHWLGAALAACLAAPLHAQPAAAPAPPPAAPVAAQRPATPPANPALALVKPTFTPRNASGIYALGDTVAWTAALPAGATPAAGGYVYKVRKNNLEILETGILDFSRGPATIDVVVREPMMVYAEVTVPGYDAGAVARLGAAVAPSKLLPSVPRPADFDAFWDGKLKALAAIPIDPVVTPVESPDASVELYAVALRSLGSTARAWLAKPKTPGPYPALVILQWAGVYALTPKAAVDRAAEGWLVLNVSSHDMPLERDSDPAVARRYGDVGAFDRETSYFLNMYLRDVRGVDYVASRPDWDGRHLVLMGTSMGGQQSLVTAALHPKVTAVLVNEPAGADSNGDRHGRKAGYPNWDAEFPQVMQTARYFDVVNFAPRITAPALVTVGFIDTITPPVGILAAFNQIAGPKELIPMIESDHNNRTPEKQGEWEARWRAVLKALVSGGTFVPAPSPARSATP